MVALRHEGGETKQRCRHLHIVRTETLELVRRDTLPEHAEYRDAGCELSSSCLRCPLARCKYDARGGARRMTTDARDREIALLRRRHGAPIDMLADTYGLTRRSIFRILRRVR
jgi:hypothetical protein